MVFVFGIDIPLVELIFVLTLILIGLFGLLIYVTIKQHQLNKRLESILSKENTELKSLKEISHEEKSELKLLRFIRTELDKLIYGEELMELKGKEKEKFKRIANKFWKEMIRIGKAKKAAAKKRAVHKAAKTLVLQPAKLTIVHKTKKHKKPKKAKRPKPKKKKPKPKKQKKPGKKPKPKKRKKSRKPKKKSKPKRAKSVKKETYKLEGILKTE